MGMTSSLSKTGDQTKNGWTCVADKLECMDSGNLQWKNSEHMITLGKNRAKEKFFGESGILAPGKLRKIRIKLIFVLP